MKKYEPFEVRRHGPGGPDSHKHTFCVVAVANPECVRLGYSGESASINGASSSDGPSARRACERLCSALNQAFERYMHGEFHAE